MRPTIPSAPISRTSTWTCIPARSSASPGFGNGQQELLYAISGEGPAGGEIPGADLRHRSGRMMPGRRRKAGLCFVPEERLGRGAVPSMSLAENAILTAAKTRGFVRKGLLDFAAARALRRRLHPTYNVKCGGRRRRRARCPAATCRSSSSAARCCRSRRCSSSRSRPGASTSARPHSSGSRSSTCATPGCAVLVISEELDELFEICDRIAVIAKGRLSPAKRRARPTSRRSASG
jgi:simple sugar transport system ATP-binding protein